MRLKGRREINRQRKVTSGERDQHYMLNRDFSVNRFNFLSVSQRRIAYNVTLHSKVLRNLSAKFWPSDVINEVEINECKCPSLGNICQLDYSANTINLFYDTRVGRVGAFQHLTCIQQSHTKNLRSPPKNSVKGKLFSSSIIIQYDLQKSISEVYQLYLHRKKNCQ